MQDILISVIVPVFNVEKFLSKCIDSIIHQTYKKLEIILVDDGSKDNSGQICDEYASKDERIKVIHKDNEGVAQARITGFENCSGSYISFVDGDDYISASYIEKLIGPVCEYKVDFVCCWYNIQKGEKITPVHYPTKGLFDRTRIFTFISSQYLYDDNLGHSGIPIFLWTKLIKREYVKKGLLAGKGVWWGEDQIAAFHIIMSVKSMFIVDECLYYYVRRDNQATSIYKTSLWLNQLSTYLRYKAIDKDNLLKSQLVKHVWKYSFLVNLYKKMPMEIHSCSAFFSEMERIEKMEGWREYFSSKKTGLGRRNDIIFWLLKLRMYYILYFVFLKRVYKPSTSGH